MKKKKKPINQDLTDQMEVNVGAEVLITSKKSRYFGAVGVILGIVQVDKDMVDELIPAYEIRGKTLPPPKKQWNDEETWVETDPNHIFIAPNRKFSTLEEPVVAKHNKDDQKEREGV